MLRPMSATWKHVVSYDCDERTESDVGLFDFAIAEGFAAIEQNELSVGIFRCGPIAIKKRQQCAGVVQGCNTSHHRRSRDRYFLTETKPNSRKKLPEQPRRGTGTPCPS